MGFEVWGGSSSGPRTAVTLVASACGGMLNAERNGLGIKRANELLDEHVTKAYARLCSFSLGIEEGKNPPEWSWNWPAERQKAEKRPSRAWDQLEAQARQPVNFRSEHRLGAYHDHHNRNRDVQSNLATDAPVPGCPS